MLQTLGFDIAIEHPHTFVVKCCQLVRASKDLAQTCYFMATNSLHLTTMCLQHRPTVVACVCIHLACKWSNWEASVPAATALARDSSLAVPQIPQSSEGKGWWYYVDTDVSIEKLEELTKEFLTILDKCPSRLKRKIMSGGGQGSGCDTLPPHNSSSDAATCSHVSLASPVGLSFSRAALLAAGVRVLDATCCHPSRLSCRHLLDLRHRFLRFCLFLCLSRQSRAILSSCRKCSLERDVAPASQQPREAVLLGIQGKARTGATRERTSRRTGQETSGGRASGARTTLC